MKDDRSMEIWPEKVERDPDLVLDLERGKVLRDQGMEKVGVREAKWSERAEGWIESLREGTVFTSDHVTQAVGLPESRNAVGAAMAGARKKGLVAGAGIAQSERPERHAGMVRLWRRI